MQIEDTYLQLLRRHSLKKYGKNKLNSTDCSLLSEKVQSLGFKINPQTYRRFFGLIHYQGGYSGYTLNSLAVYCDFGNYEDFKKRITINELDLFFKTLFEDNSKQDYWQLSENLCQRISKSPTLLVSVHYQLMKYPLARKFFMENHPMRDMICTVYAQYFQEYLKFVSGTEAKLFAYGFLFMGAFLSNNIEFMRIYYQQMTNLSAEEDIHVLPAGRKYGVQLLYAWLRGDEALFNEYYKEMLIARGLFKSKSEKSVCSFEYVVLEHLIFTDKIQEMLYLIHNNTCQKYSDEAYIPQNRKENHEEVWKILCAVAYDKAGNREKTHQYLNSVNLHKLNYGWIKYYSILYYLVLQNYCEETLKNDYLSTLNILIRETHFTYFEKLAESEWLPSTEGELKKLLFYRNQMY